MSEGTLPRDRFEAIEAYLMGTLPLEDRARFEAELTHDADLRHEVDLQREHVHAVELGGIRRSLRQIMAEDRQESRAWVRYIGYAATVALLLGGALWWHGRPPLNERLYAEYHEEDPGLPVPMSALRNPAFQDAMVAYKLGEYQEARNKWSVLLKASPGNDTLQYYIASASLSTGDAGAAIPLFKAVAADAASAFHAKARWFLFLAYLREGRVQEMKALGLEADPVYGDRVQAIEGRLKP